MEGTVTIQLSEYEDMKDEIKRLREENKEKEIIKSEPHWTMILLFALFVFSLFFLSAAINSRFIG